MKQPVRIAVTGAAGNISYAMLFRIASGEMLGKDQPVILNLLEITPALDALKGVVMELQDCAFPLLVDIVQTDDAKVAFKDVSYALLVGSRPRGPGMERKDLLEANAAIFSAQGKALNEVAKRDVKVLVVGNPANTNAVIAQRNAPDLDPRNFTAMTRLDHNRAIAQLAEKTEQVEEDPDKGVTMGLFSYPILMSADILMFNANEVPVGKDQTQHLEMARDIGARFNHHFGEHFAMPKTIVDDNVAVLPGLDGRKMSKSYNNTIPLWLTEN